MRMNAVLVTLAVTVIALGFDSDPAGAQATRTWVSGVGDDAQPCSRTAPCKTFAGAISKTAPNGEINCLDPGGFGAVTITKSLTIDCTGTHGSVLVSGTNAIVVNAGASANVILRGLAINGVTNGLSGIKFIAGAQLSVEQCFIVGFATAGIEVNAPAFSTVAVTNTYITNATKGIFVTSTGLTTMTVNITSIVHVNVGLETQAKTVAALTNSTVLNAGNSAVLTSGASEIDIDKSTIVNSNIAVNANASGSIIRVSDTNIYSNSTNFNVVGGATLLSAGNNRTTPTGGSNPTGSIPLR